MNSDRVADQVLTVPSRETFSPGMIGARPVTPRFALVVAVLRAIVGSWPTRLCWPCSPRHCISSAVARRAR